MATYVFLNHGYNRLLFSYINKCMLQKSPYNFRVEETAGIQGPFIQ